MDENSSSGQALPEVTVGRLCPRVLGSLQSSQRKKEQTLAERNPALSTPAARLAEKAADSMDSPRWKKRT